mmetsp:Transcript_38432/g.63664  ORF Transcript_38432/g.63664 Transcript_38432/m.63664 type:complete len:696 (+) Transcript_38432:3650-5737(+)
MELCLAWLFTDGCRAQYKGKRNFRRISTFAHEHSAASFELLQPPDVTFTSDVPVADAAAIAVARATDGANATASSATIETIARLGAAVDLRLQPRSSKAPKDWGTFKIHTVYLRHLFACGHHFKGPHDGFGKDGKHLPRCAEKQQKVRIATAHELYHFDATNLPCPRRNVLASDIVASLAPAPAAALQRRTKSNLPADWRAMLSPSLRRTDPIEDAIAEHLGRAAVVHTPSTDAIADVDSYQQKMHDTARVCESQAQHHEPDVEEQGSVLVNSEESTSVEITVQPPSGDLQAGLDTTELLEEEIEVDLDDPNGSVSSSISDLHEPDSEAEEFAGDFDFEFDETGARVTREEQQEDTGDLASPSSVVGPSSDVLQQLQPTAKAARKSRTVRILTKAAGGECRDGGEERIITQKHKQPGIFTASSYMWLYYAVYPATGVSLVPVGSLAGPNEAHGVLDPCENYDADAVADSNSMYDFAGVDSEQPGLLYSKALPCVAPCCRDIASVSLVNRQCPFWATTGRWRQNTVNPIANVPLQQQKQRMKTELFRAQMLLQPPIALYAVYADPRRLEAGQHPYWLVETRCHPYAAPRGLKDAYSITITVGTYIVDVNWFQCTSNDPNHKAYKKLDVLEPTSEERNANEKDVDASCSVVHLKMKAFITETCLEWAHFSPRLGTGVFADESHLRLMRHNFSNVTSS